jgi:hypothetical protein
VNCSRSPRLRVRRDARHSDQRRRRSADRPIVDGRAPIVIRSGLPTRPW